MFIYIWLGYTYKKFSDSIWRLVVSSSQVMKLAFNGIIAMANTNS